jgi:hypothetical protein
MRRTRWTWPVLAMALLVFQPGCLIMHNSTRVIRESEPLRPVRFESEQARSVFEDGVSEARAHKKKYESCEFAVPFVCLLSRTSEVSDNAVYNDQVVFCDANGDGLITEQEAAAYRALVAERIRTDGDTSTANQKSGGRSKTVSLH